MTTLLCPGPEDLNHRVKDNECSKEVEVATGLKNNGCELSYQPTRQQERQMRRFKSQGQAQRFLSCHGVVNNLFRFGRHLMQAKHYRTFRDRAFSEWSQVSCAQM